MTRITRDPRSSPTAADLFLIFGKAANDYSISDVIDASANMIASAIGVEAKAEKRPLEVVLAQAEAVANAIKECIKENWERKDQPGDVLVIETDGTPN